MKRSIFVLVLIMLFGLMTMGASNMAVAGTGFARSLDDDGDGIPNGDDLDYVAPLDGSGNKFGAPAAAAVSTTVLLPLRYSWNWFMPLAGGLWVPQLSVAGYGPGDGTGYDGEGPLDGTGYGPGPYGTGDCK